MNKKVTIVMYHFVREIKESRYKGIKGLEYKNFKKQINFFINNYNIIKMEDMINLKKENKEFPEKCLILTFDDGYKDHFDYVFPILDKYNIQGSFFAPVKAIKENKVLDVNKIHFILSECNNKLEIIEFLKEKLKIYKKEFDLESFEYYQKIIDTSSRFDTPEVIFIKRMLQVILPEKFRNMLVNELFYKYVSSSEESFSKDLYLNIDQIKCMIKNGMHFGAHSYDHCWLSALSKHEQEIQIEKSLSFLKEIGMNNEYFTICYPYGD